MEGKNRLTEDQFTLWRSWVMERLVISAVGIIIIIIIIIWCFLGKIWCLKTPARCLMVYVVFRYLICIQFWKIYIFFHKCKKYYLLMFCTRNILFSIGILVVIYRFYVMSAVIRGKLSFIGTSCRTTHAFVANTTIIAQFSIIT